jgi:hypothetical protein
MHDPAVILELQSTQLRNKDGSMDHKHKVIWTWCPRCTVRTDHYRINGQFHCLACGCIHVSRVSLAAVNPSPTYLIPSNSRAPIETDGSK